MVVTKRDLLISTFIEEFSFCTLEQVEKIFFRPQGYALNIARKRLRELERAGYITIKHDCTTGRNIYLWNASKDAPKVTMPTMSKLKILDVYAELKYIGANIETFIPKDKFWNDGKIRSDGFTIFTFGNRRYYYFIEVQYSNHFHNLEKYDILYATNEVQEYLGKDIFPNVLFICDRQYGKMDVRHTSVLQLPTDLHKFALCLL